MKENISNENMELFRLYENRPAGESGRKFAERMGMSWASVKNRLYRTRKALGVAGKRDPRHNEIFQAIKTRPTSLRDLSIKFDRSERTVRGWLDDMERSGYSLIRSTRHVQSPKSADPGGRPEIRRPLLEDAQELRFAVASDWHAGSTCAQPTSLNYFIQEAYHDYGIRHVFVVGDISAGVYGYRGHEYDLVPTIRPRARKEAHLTTRAELWLADQYAPKLPGLQYYLLGGNHDWWHVVNSGLDLAAMLCGQRDDMHYLGYDVADIPLTEHVGARLWHPSGGVPYALSYRLQKNLEQVAFEELNKLIDTGTPPKVRFLLSGHLHIEVKFQRGPMTAAQVGCFEGKTNYLKKKGLTPSIGGQIWRVVLSDSGQIYRVGYDFIPYPEIEDDWASWPVIGLDDVTGTPDEMEYLFSTKSGPGYDGAYGDHQYYGK